MLLSVWLTYLMTVLFLMLTPGPSQLLMLANSLTYGFKPAIATALGDISANLLQMLIVGLSLTTVILWLDSLFVYIKWLGILYLLYLGISLLLNAKKRSNTPLKKANHTRGSLYWQGFITSAANPKALLFFTALFPQFIDISQHFYLQFSILSLTYVICDLCFLLTYAATAQYLTRKYQTNGKTIVAYLSGSFILAAAAIFVFI